jgi:MFS family permease
MTGVPTRSVRRRPGWLPALAVGYGLTLLQVGGGLVTPLYPIYQDRWDAGPGTVTLLFAGFVLGVVLSLLFVSPAADSWDRRSTLLAITGVSVLASALYLVVDGPLGVLVANLVQGIAVGAFTGVAPAALGDRLPVRTVGRVTTFASAAGLAIGPLWSGLLAEYAPAPGRLVFALQIALTVALVAALLTVPGERAASRPRFRVAALHVPREGRGRFGRASAAGFCAFAVGGLFASIGPVIMVSLLDTRVAFAGLVVALVFTVSAAVQPAFRSMPVGRMMALGLALLTAGTVLLLATVLLTSIVLVLASAVLLGAGQGCCLQSGVSEVTETTRPERRAAAFSAFYLICYAGTALPALAVGAVAAAAGLRTAVLGFGVAFALACLGTLAAVAGPARSR